MNKLPPPCKGGCGRGIRPRKSTPEDYPYNTKVEKAGGFCGKCYVPHHAPKMWQQPCAGCGSDMRPNGADRRDYPGTNEHHTRGYCTSCRTRERRGLDYKPRATAPDACTCCGEALRPRHSTEDTHPGTVEHAGKGVCRGCEDKIRKGRIHPPCVEGPLEPTEDKGLDRFTREREERKRKAALRDARIAQAAAQRAFIARRRAS